MKKTFLVVALLLAAIVSVWAARAQQKPKTVVPIYSMRVDKVLAVSSKDIERPLPESFGIGETPVMMSCMPSDQPLYDALGGVNATCFILVKKQGE